MVTNDWQQSNMQFFWGEIASNDHILQIYEDDTSFINTLEGFAASGFLAGDSVIVIATEKHLNLLNNRLVASGFDIGKFIADDLYIPLDADEALEIFMLNGMPEESRFMKLTKGLLRRGRKNSGKVRAFGEMVVQLWNKGQTDATHELEALWKKLQVTEPFCLFCAYPKKILTPSQSVHVCNHHTKVISGVAGPSTQVRYKSVDTTTAI
jgi:hypothetical protein